MHRLNGRIAAIFCALRWRAFMAPELPTYPTLATELHRGENQMAEAHLNCVASAVPPHDIHAAFVCFARTLLSRQADRALFDRMVGRAHIAHRYAVLPASIDPAGESLDEAKLYRRGGFPGTALRMHLFERHAPELAAAALGKLSKEAQLGRVTHVIVTSCTGLYAPGLDHTIVQLLGLSGSVERTVVGFMGCSAGVQALKLARHIVRAEPTSRVLIVNLELCSLHLQEVDDLEQMLSFLLFGDGCAVSLVSAEPRGLSLDRFHAVSLPHTADLITWRIGDSGFEMHLSGRVPNAIATGLGCAAQSILGAESPIDIDCWAVHPGGRTILDAVQRGLGLDASALAASRNVLEHFGNMSSASLSFVLEAVLRDARSGARGCALAFGPGLCAETMSFHKV